MKQENNIIELIDHLAAMVKRGFDRVYEKIDEIKIEMDERFSNVDDELKAIKNVRIGGQGSRIDKFVDDITGDKGKSGDQVIFRDINLSLK